MAASLRSGNVMKSAQAGSYKSAFSAFMHPGWN